MSLFVDFGTMKSRFENFLEVGKPPLRSLIESAVIFDKISIPTNDFLPLAVLLATLGEKNVTALLDEGILTFSRLKGGVGYLGNGAGLSDFAVSSHTGTPMAFCGPLDEAVHILLGGLNIQSNKAAMAYRVIEATVEFGIKDDFRDFKNEVYQDCRTLFPKYAHEDLDRAPGILADQVTILSSLPDPTATREIDQILRVAHAHIEARSAVAAGATDIYTSGHVSEIFQLKTEALVKRDQVIREADPLEALFVLREIADIPNIGEYVLQDRDGLSSILKLRASTNAVQFRAWFHENVRADPTKIGAEYAKLLKSVPWIQSVKAKKIRLMAQAAAGIATSYVDPLTGFLTGLSLNAVDSFVVDSVFKGNSPKYFLEDLQRIKKQP